MNIPVWIIDENGKGNTIVISQKFLAQLSEKLRTEGITEVHTTVDGWNSKTYKVQAVVLMAKGCNGNVMFIPNEENNHGK
jgi:hypothetical protein